MTIDTGAAAPTNSVIVHYSSEDLRRISIQAATELGKRNGEFPSFTLEQLAKEAADREGV